MNKLQILRKKQNHAILRARQRYGIKLSDFEYFSLINQIFNGSAKYIYQASDQSAIFEVIHMNNGKEVPMYAAYGIEFEMIQTFLRPEWVIKKKNKKLLRENKIV